MLLGILGWVVAERQSHPGLTLGADPVDHPDLEPETEIVPPSLEPPIPPVAAPKPRGRITSGLAGYKYLCFEPSAYRMTNGAWPLIIFLHGACQDENLEKLKFFGPIKYA